MSEKLIVGRKREISLLNRFIDSDEAEFVAVYGRRRVGKTYLVKSLFQKNFSFYMTGLANSDLKKQLQNFTDAFSQYFSKKATVKNWFDAFNLLRDELSKLRKTKKIIFIDELPWFDTARSDFVSALEHFWNSWASDDPTIKLIVCGSATSWMMRNIVNNRAGLHKRTTHVMHLRPFSLGQTEEYLISRKFHWPRIAILQAYMVLGGIPYYLGLLDPKKNLPDNVDTLFFSAEAELDGEYQRLFKSLFRSADTYMEIIRLLSTRRDGYTRREISEKLNMPDNGALGDMLDDLEQCDFLRRYNNGRRQNGGIYQLVDFFSLFYHRYCMRRVTDEHFWRNRLGTPEQNNWYGLTFERVALWHVSQIIRGLHLDTIAHEYYAWRSRESKPAVQIDMVIDRADGIATICEMKYSKDDYSITEGEYRNIIRRMEAFSRETSHKGGVQAVIVTTYALHANMFSEIVSQPITMQQLFMR